MPTLSPLPMARGRTNRTDDALRRLSQSKVNAYNRALAVFQANPFAAINQRITADLKAAGLSSGGVGLGFKGSVPVLKGVGARERTKMNVIQHELARTGKAAKALGGISPDAPKPPELGPTIRAEGNIPSAVESPVPTGPPRQYGSLALGPPWASFAEGPPGGLSKKRAARFTVLGGALGSV